VRTRACHSASPATSARAGQHQEPVLLRLDPV